MTIVEDTDLELVVGDSEDFLLTLRDENDVLIDLSKAVDGTANRPAIIRFAVKDNADDDNSLARVYKTSFDTEEIQVLTQSGATLAMARILVDKPDTEDIEPSSKRWDCEVTRQDFIRPLASVGTVSLTAGSNAVVGAGTDFTKAKVGDVLMPTSGTNTKPALISKIISATSLEVEDGIVFTATEPGITFEIRRGKSRTAARGNMAMSAGIVRK
jgi:hypothetical protein